MLKRRCLMPILNSKTGKIRKDYSIEELVKKAREMRAYSMISITAAGSGHTGGTLSLYIALAESGYFPLDDTVKLRKLWSGFEGHPNRLKLPGIELSAGSLGQGLGVAVGCALNANPDNYYKGYSL
jgi:transketolase